MAGLDFPDKLRRGLGGGKVVPPEVIAQKLGAFDRDKDGAVTQEELAFFLQKHHVGGPWFCKLTAQTVWKVCQDWVQADVGAIRVDAMARSLASMMKAKARPARRYVVTPEVVQGYEDPVFLDEMKQKAAPRAASKPATGAPAAKPGAPAAKPGAPAAKPGAPAAAKPGAPSAKPVATASAGAGGPRPRPRPRPGPR
ncbi:MAG: hypothetical protein HY791_00230 [Deltaproteobacteria bacterium]|nr:hypothetical protein [Deltaproteobacteria bacterium]